jgi:membrane protease YdiL (CAAX protease family)
LLSSAVTGSFALQPIGLTSIVFIVIGAIGEEIGWRGYLLILLVKKYTWLKSSFILGVLWAFWHVVPMSYLGITAFFIYAVLIMTWTLVITWLYAKSNFNIITAILAHSVFNISVRTFLVQIDIEQLIYLTAIGLAIIVVLICTSSVFKRRKENE